jgi:phage tail sheath protein FI
LHSLGTQSQNASVYFPRIREANPLHADQLQDFAPCGAVAGVIARIDQNRGVWNAPAGAEATLRGVASLTATLSDEDAAQLTRRGINCLRTLPRGGPLVWGARTLQGDERVQSDWKYVPVRRLALFIEESVDHGTQWVVFELNDEPLWAKVRLNVGAFLDTLFRGGAFQGSTARQAYFVKCDRETNTQSDIDSSRLNILIGFAPLKPAEFVLVRLQKHAERPTRP